MGRPLKIAKSATIDNGFNNPVGNTYGVVGGDTAIAGQQILAQVAIGQTGTGTITAGTSSDQVVGTGTSFATELAVGSVIETPDGVVLGFVESIEDSTNLTLTASATAVVTNSAFVFATSEAGFIIRQKGKTKYLVQGSASGLVGACFSTNAANAALTTNTFNMVATLANTSTVNLKTVNNYWGSDFAGNKYIASFNGAATAPAGSLYPVVDVRSA